MNLADAIEFHAHSQPEHIAVIAGNTELSYRDFAMWVKWTQAWLEQSGIGREALVGVCLKDTVDHLAIIYALARMGAVMLPMDWRWSAEEKQRLTDHFRPAAVIVEHDAAAIEACRNLRVEAANGKAVSEQGAVRPSVHDPDLPLLLSLSSGTTGRPKGPRITHSQMLRRFWTHWINLGLNASDRYVSATPLYFGGGRTFAMSVLFSGGTIILFPPPFESVDLCRIVDDKAATSTFLVPTQLRKLLELSTEESIRLQRLRLLICSGAPLHVHERAAIGERISKNLVEYYASTEGGGVSIATPEDRKRYPNTVGRAVFAVEIEIVDDDDKALQSGEIGHLRYRGPGVATTYFDDDVASADAFRDGWFYPGDLAEMNDGGYVFIRGRSKDVINRGGVNIHPSEIETILANHPAVVEAAVVGRPSGKFGEEVAAFVITRGGADEAELVSWCKGRLAPYKVPRSVFLVGELPKNSAGKVLKNELVARLEPL